MQARQLADRRGGERGLAGEHLVEHESERVDVGLDRRRLVIEELGRHVGRRARQRMPARFLDQRGEAEVRQPDLAPAVDHHVRGLQIAMEHALVVRRGQPRAQLARHVDRGVMRQPADSPQQRRQVLAVDVLHRQEGMPVDLADVVDAADVRVRHFARHPHLGAEPLDPLGPFGDLVRQELERDLLLEHEIVGAIDLAHAAAPEQAGDAIATREQRAGGKAAFERALRERGVRQPHRGRGKHR